ncbi:MAG TPA: hypothetical protein VHS78_06455 [Candidatus Elarobacter sp.]|jgi:hypothetical protein|nr:hypothetical protein [Candidatus Elarobacter sp.]
MGAAQLFPADIEEYDFVVNHSADFAQDARHSEDPLMSSFIAASVRGGLSEDFMERAHREVVFDERVRTEGSTIKRLIRNYQTANWAHFESAVQGYLPPPQHRPPDFSLDRQIDRNYALYMALEQFIAPLVTCESHVETIQDLFAWVYSVGANHSTEFNKFLAEISADGYLIRAQSDGLRLYERTIDIAGDLRQVLAEWDPNKPDDVDRPGLRVTGKVRFDDIKTAFSDSFELLSRGLTLVTAIENIEMRGNHDLYAPHPRLGKKFHPLTMRQFHESANGPKAHVPKSKFGRAIAGALDSRLRNGVGHYTARLDPASGLLHYPKDKSGKVELTMEYPSFLLRITRSLFRVHQLNHLVKILFALKLLMEQRAGATASMAP